MNEIWKPIFEEIISLVDKYVDKGVNASFIEENSLEVRIGNPPDYVVNIFIYNQSNYCKGEHNDFKIKRWQCEN